MFKLLGRTAGNLVGIEAGATLTPKDFAALRDQLDPLIKEYGKVCLLFDLSSLTQFEGEGLWDESSFEDQAALDRVAVIVDSRLADKAEAVFALGAAYRSYTPDEAERAWRWVATGD